MFHMDTLAANHGELVPSVPHHFLSPATFCTPPSARGFQILFLFPGFSFQDWGWCRKAIVETDGGVDGGFPLSKVIIPHS